MMNYMQILLWRIEHNNDNCLKCFVYIDNILYPFLYKKIHLHIDIVSLHVC